MSEGIACAWACLPETLSDARIYAGYYVEGLAIYTNFRVFSVTTSETLP
jgi:hypothetical protein